jgi:hypothetical protein
MTTRLPPISNEALKQLYRQCVELGAVLAHSDWSPPPTSTAELINRIRKDKE